ncbi:unnamed protein product [Rotaria sp. Silwood2]|nr:unnamed protein product [Rotaria sp. Silwood2]CAF2520238.1 unnamed protein product [Rotaria sp. Silwood2]CAF2776339.1 unnamed protein product [Rotaria sp. Silwood2]CAF2919953.1 unnamed protein product [Rotaria sp. Silwood2]CAF4028782.1 unnamed protein product [Rotaria sp. Silwood2]
MSTPTMNHNSHMHQRQEQQQQHQQQQEQQINEIQHAHSNSANSPHATLTRSDSTSTVILEEEETRTYRRNGPRTLPPAVWASLSIHLRSALKTSGLFNKDLESSDKLNELFANGNEFALQKLLSEVGANDINIDMNELMKLDSTKLFDSRTLSDFLRSESFDQLIASTINSTDVNPSAIACSTTSFSELRPVSPELTTNNIFHRESDQLKLGSDHPLLYSEMNSFDSLTSMTDPPQFDYNQGALSAFEHDHAFLSKRAPVIDTPKSPNSKRTPTRGPRRTSSRIQSRAVCSTSSESSASKSKQPRNVSRATDIKTAADLSYYLERRRKNNEASKMSRAARKQKFGDMDHHCEEYERVNAELRMKIITLETVTATLKNGLVNNFQRKPSV